MTKKVKFKSKKEMTTGKKSKVMKKKVVGKKMNIKVAKKKPLDKNSKDKPIKKKAMGKKIKTKKTKSVKTAMNLENDNAEANLENTELEDKQGKEISKPEDDLNVDDGMEVSSEGEEVEPSDGEDDQEDEGYVEPVAKDIFSEKTIALKKPMGGNHMIFNDDEDFEDLTYLIPSGSVVKKPSNDIAEESDSDAPPDEGTISTGKNALVDDNLKMKKEIMHIKKQVKEARRLKHEKNREQQMKKRERLQKLENSRLPEDLLDAVAREEKQTKETVASEPKRKIITFSDDIFDDQMFTDAANEGDVITLNEGVQVRSIQRELKKHASIASIAADFRYRALYKKVSNRMTSIAQRQMLVKQRKSGKCNMLS